MTGIEPIPDEQVDGDEFDVVVVGGGPAGSTAAYTAATLGLRTCLVDRQIFPREKLCGGLVTPRTRTLFEEIHRTTLPETLFFSSDLVTFFSDAKWLAQPDPYCTLYFTMRKEFDAHLLGLAEQAGAMVRVGHGVESIDRSDKRVTLSNGSSVRYRVLIGADGVHSIVAKTLFGSSFNNDTIGFGLEVEVPRERLPNQSNAVEIDFGAARWGYGWVFPKHKTFTIGVGGIHRLNPDLKARFEAYLEIKHLALSEFKVKGQYIPFGDYRRVPGSADILLCGDAAGVVDPITGEGIAYALQTGHHAAQAAATAIRGNVTERALETYLPHYRLAAKAIDQANWWRYLIFPQLLRKPFGWAFADASTLQKGYLDILRGSHGYNALYWLFAKQAAKAVRKLGRRLIGKKDPNS
ncbi:MAG: NAD(P)/FAD-dependent oxidoreductase [Rhodospirillaceae bacterium]